jgi:alanine racemase
MDWTTLDVTGVEGAQLGDEVILIGTDNELQIRAEDLARSTNTISYEITCGINRRVPRLYKSNLL